MSRLVSSASLVELSGMPGTTRGVKKLLQRIGLKPEKRAGLGGSNQYDLDHPATQKLPAVTQLALGKLFDGDASARSNHPGGSALHVEGPPDSNAVILVAPGKTREASHRRGSDEHADAMSRVPVTESQRKSFDCLREIIRDFDHFHQLRGGLFKDALADFVVSCNADRIEFSDETSLFLKRRKPLTTRTLRRWRADLRPPRTGNRRGASRLRAEHRRFIEALINDHARSSHIFQGFLARFEDPLKRGYDRDGRKLPSESTVGRYAQKWKLANRTFLESTANPSRFRSHRRFAIAQADGEIVHPNLEWQVDGTPADVLLRDGRRSILAVIDVFTRRAMFLVAPSESTDAALLLVRRAIIAWGVPARLRGDNGSGFVSQRFQSGLADLEIEYVPCAPYSPEQKGFVERAFGFMSQSLLERLPGFKGHSVAERQKLREQASFGQRAASDRKLYEIALSSSELQRTLDRWADDFAGNHPRSSLSDLSPNQVAASWPGPIRRIEDERALDLLLAPAPQNPFRCVGKRGISVDGAYFAAPELSEFAGQSVRVFVDPADMGHIVCYTASDPRQFICVATNLDRLGVVARQELALVMKQRLARFVSGERKRLSKIAHAVKPHLVLGEVIDHAAATGTPPPTGEMLARDVAFSTHALVAAKVASDALRPVEDAEAVETYPHIATAPAISTVSRGNELFAKYQMLQKRLPESLGEEDRLFMAIFPTRPEYKVRARRLAS